MKTASTNIMALLLLLAATSCAIVSSSSCPDDLTKIIPSVSDLLSKFSLLDHQEGTYSNEIFRSPMNVIFDPSDDKSLEYNNATSVALVLLTPFSKNQQDDFFDCWEFWDEGPRHDDDNGGTDDGLLDCVNKQVDKRSLRYFHKLDYDQVWRFYFGDSIYIYELDNAVENDMLVTVLGRDVFAGEVLQHTVPAGTWFAVQVNPLSEMAEPYALGGTVVAPGVDYEKYTTLAKPHALITEYPNAQDKIEELTYSVTVSDNSFAVAKTSSFCDQFEYPLLEELVEHFSMNEGPMGGYYAEAYSSSHHVLAPYGTRCAMSTYYYLVNRTATFHKQENDETIHFYFGEPLILYEIDDTKAPRVLRAIPIGANFSIGEVPAYTIKAGNWMAYEMRYKDVTTSDITNASAYSLISLTKGPGYKAPGSEFQDLIFAEPEDLADQFPEFSSAIWALYENGTTLDDEGNLPGIVYTSYIATSQKGDYSAAASVGGPSQAGLIVLYVVVASSLAVILAFVLYRGFKRLAERTGEDETWPVTVLVERGGKVTQVETLHEKFGRSKTIDITGKVSNVSLYGHFIKCWVTLIV